MEGHIGSDGLTIVIGHDNLVGVETGIQSFVRCDRNIKGFTLSQCFFREAINGEMRICTSGVCDFHIIDRSICSAHISNDGGAAVEACGISGINRREGRRGYGDQRFVVFHHVDGLGFAGEDFVCIRAFRAHLIDPGGRSRDAIAIDIDRLPSFAVHTVFHITRDIDYVISA